MTNTEIKIKTFLPDGTESGEMTMPIDNVLTMAQFSFFAKLCRESDEKAGTQAIETIKSEIMARIAECKTESGEYKSEWAKKDGEKLEKKLLTVCPELKEQQRKLKTVAKNQLYFWVGKDRENNIMITAHLGDKYQLPGGYYAFIEKEQCKSLKEKPKYRASEESTGMMIKKGSLKEVKEFLKEMPEQTIKNAMESSRAKENAEMIKNVKSGKIDKNEILILTNDINERDLIRMHLSDMYANAEKQAETSETETEETETTEPTENHLEESRKEESAPTEAKGESTMKENTNAAAQAQEAQATEKKYTVEQVRQITGLNSESVRITAHTFPDYDGGTYQAFRAAFVAGTAYKIPEKYVKSAAAEIIFTVVSNSGKSLKVNIYEKYNGKISEQINKTKKLCPGGHGHWLVFDTVSKKFMHEWRTDEKQNTIEFFQVDTIESGNISRWTNGYISCYECIPMTETEFDNWRQNPGTATTNSAQPGRKTAEELDFTPIFYPVSEELARQHKNMISWSDYKPGTVTAEYQEAVKEAYELAKKSDDTEKSLYLADVYARRLARWYDDYNRNGAACPSVMISGAGNFPTRKKEKQNARFDTLMHQYDKIKHLLEKIRKPHGYGVEIRRDTITAEEFENILYFETIINEEENRLQLVFDGKPEEAERNILKKNGFRWSPRFKAWQRQLTENAVSAVWKVVDEFDRLEDAENVEIQAETEKIKSATPESERTETVENPVETVEAEQETQSQPETIPTEADTSPTGSPEQSAPETIQPHEETATETPQAAETSTAGETEAVGDWSGVKFAPIPGIPDPETVGADTAEHADKLTEALEKLDRMRHKLDKSTYTSTGNNRYYNGFWSAVCCIFGAVLYDTETGKHYLQAVSETIVQPDETAKAQAEAEESSIETVQTAETVTEPEQAADETIKFEPGKIYSAIHITNSDYISAYKVISRTAKTIILENSSGERFRKRPTVTDGYINGKQCHCETVYPDGVYSMCLVLRATDTVEAETPKQAETEYHTAQQAQTAAAVSAARQQRIIQTAGGKITMTVNGAAQ